MIGLLEREGNRDSYQDYVSQIKDLYTTMKFADIDFVVGTERFAAHKVILATRSPFFAKLFFSKKITFFISLSISKKRWRKRI